MTCENSWRLLHAYYDGELDAVRAAEFEEHLNTCPECARELHELQLLRQSVQKSNLRERAPKSLRSRIQAAFPADNGGPKVVAMWRRPAFQWLAIAAVVVIAVALGAREIPNLIAQRQMSLFTEEILASHIRSLQPGHLFDVEATDQHTVKPWFDGKLDFSPPVVDLAADGFPLIGGRLDYVDERNVAALIYQRRKHFINVFVWPDASGASSTQIVESRRGYNVVRWSRGGFQFWAVSDVSAADLGQFGQLFQSRTP